MKKFLALVVSVLLGGLAMADPFITTAGTVDVSAISVPLTSGVAAALNAAVVIALIVLVAFVAWRIFRRMVGR